MFIIGAKEEVCLTKHWSTEPKINGSNTNSLVSVGEIFSENLCDSCQFSGVIMMESFEPMVTD